MVAFPFCALLVFRHPTGIGMSTGYGRKSGDVYKNKQGYGLRTVNDYELLVGRMEAECWVWLFAGGSFFSFFPALEVIY